jgi:hypothetical protein
MTTLMGCNIQNIAGTSKWRHALARTPTRSGFVAYHIDCYVDLCLQFVSPPSPHARYISALRCAYVDCGLSASFSV